MFRIRPAGVATSMAHSVYFDRVTVYFKFVTVYFDYVTVT